MRTHVLRGVVTMLILLSAVPLLAAGELDETHLVPIEKGLSEEWVRSLFDRGEPALYSGEELNAIGMPVGGIAAGQLYLCGDGTLGQWWIFNRHHFTGIGHTSYAYRETDRPVDQGFAVIVKHGDTTVAKTLSKDGFDDVAFMGQYPVGAVRYSPKDFPLEVELKAFSPFIPLNASDSALPATIFQITVENVSQDNIQAALCTWLENAVCFHSSLEVSGVRRTKVILKDDRTLLVHTAEEMPVQKVAEPRPEIVIEDFEGDDYGDWTAEGEAFGEKPATGTLPGQQAVSGFAGKGLVNTFIAGDGPQGSLTSPEVVISRKFIRFLVGGGQHPNETCINLVVDGKVVRTACGKNDERLEWRSWRVEEFDGKKARIQIVDKQSGSWGHINIDQITLTDEPLKGPPVEKLQDYGSLVLALAERADAGTSAAKALADVAGFDDVSFDEAVSFPMSERRKAGIVSKATQLAPGAKRTFVVVLAWHFPNHPSGREYAARFDDAVTVADYVLDNYTRLTGDTMKWRDTYYESTLPYWLLDRLAVPVSTLATGTCQWWGDGRFWAWEGVGCCGGTCTHVWNYEHAGARLFPELERIVREQQDLGPALQPSGLVGHRGGGAYAADGQLGTVLKCYREHTMSPDDAFLERNWPKIKRVLEYSIVQDGNDDGLIENSQHNTYDIGFFGANTFVGSLYLAALKAGEQMAREMGDDEFAQRCAKIAESGGRLSVEKLWNGEYFVQQVDLKEHPTHQYADGCLSDQMFGQGWAHQLSLGYIYPQEKVESALRSVWTYNWAPDVGPHNAAHPPMRVFAAPGEAGLFTCTWPKSTHLEGNSVLYRNEVWTGIEYQVAGHMVWEGMLTEALAIVRAIHERYHPSKRNPYNEVECGDHYARAMASWGVFTALSGYEYHGPTGFLAFAPKLTPDNFRSAFTAAEGWGSFSQQRDDTSQTDTIEMRWGRLRLKTLAFEMPAGSEPQKVAVKLDGAAANASHSVKGNRVTITFADVVVNEGKALTVVISK